MRHRGTQPLDTPRLHLRRFVPEDAEAMYAGWAQDPEVTRWLRWTPHPDIGETRRVLAEWAAAYEQPGTYLWAMERREDARLIGAITITPTCEPDSPEGWEPGYCLARAFWGQGYTTEALQAVMSYFVQFAGVENLYCCHAIDNHASGHVMQKAGFVYRRETVYHRFDGSAVPAKLYAWNLRGSASAADKE